MGTDTIDLHYESVGSGPAIVLVHGGMMDMGMWEHQVEALSRDYRLVRYDLRGFGRSSALAGPVSPTADLARLLDDLGIARTHVVGASLGGAIAIDFALTYPERVASLVLAEPALAGWQFSADVMQSMMPVLSAWQAGDREGAVRAMLQTPAFEYARDHNPAAFARIRALVATNIGGLTAPGLMRFEEPRALDALDRITAPTLVLTSEGAGHDAQRIAATLERSVSDVRHLRIEESGHLMNLEQPAAFNRAVLDFLHRLDEPSSEGDRNGGDPKAGPQIGNGGSSSSGRRSGRLDRRSRIVP